MRAADGLVLAAAPVFAGMAVFAASQPDVMSSMTMGGSPLNGMAAMYALMAFFHLAPWLRLVDRWRAGLVSRGSIGEASVSAYRGR